MPVVEASICTPFKQAKETIEVWRQKVIEACQLTKFPHQPEVEKATGEMADILGPLVYGRLVRSISVSLGAVGVCFAFRSDAEPDDTDELDISALELAGEAPSDCVIEATTTDLGMAEFLGGRDLERCSTEHVRVTLSAPVPNAGQEASGKEDADGSPS